MVDGRLARSGFADDHQFNWRNLRLCALASLSALASGYGIAIISTTLGEPGFLVYMDLVDPATGEETSNASGLIGAIAGTYYAGSVCGLLTIGWVMDRWGRKAGVIYCATVGIIGIVGVTAAQNVAMFIAFRFVCGLGLNAFLAASGVLCSEIAPPALRGLFVGMVGGGALVGYSIAALVGLACFYVENPSAQWRLPLALGLVFPILCLCSLPWLPESPRWLLMQGRVDEAKAIVLDIHKSSKNNSQSFAEREFYQMERQVEIDRSLKSTYLEMFIRPAYRRRTLIALTFGFLNQSTGVFVIGAYGSIIYKSLGFGPRDVLCFQAGWIITAIPFNFLGAWLSDRWGRKPIFILGLAGCAFSLSLEAGIVATYVTPEKLTHPNQAALGVAVAALYLMIAFFGMTLEAVGTPYINEIFPNHLRSKGYSLTLAVITGTLLIYTEVGPTALEHVGWKYYLLFICCCSVGCFWVYFIFPETKGLPLEEVAALFGDADGVAVYSANIETDKKAESITVEGKSEEMSEPKNLAK